MDYYIHQSWGRIRVKVPALKNNHFKINLVRKIISRLEGIKRVSCNQITGSVVIYYDPYIILPAKIINLYRSLGLLPNVIGFPRPYHTKQLNNNKLHNQDHAATSSSSEWLSELSKYVIKTMLDKAFSQTGKVLLRKIL